MQVPSHARALPNGVDPIPMPDTKEEAEMLRQLLDAGLYPKCVETEVGNEATHKSALDGPNGGLMD